jgi:protein-tyrosine phosphatase
MGVSRSASVVCAYLIATRLIKANEALQLVKAKRDIVSPNAGFRAQLDAYELLCLTRAISKNQPTAEASVQGNVYVEVDTSTLQPEL